MPFGNGSLSTSALISVPTVPCGRPTTSHETVTELILSLRSNFAGPIALSIVANCSSLIVCPALFTKEIYIELVLNIEDITELHPGGLQMLYMKYNNLCQDNSRYSLNELKEWVESLGYKAGTKQQMCRIIKTHYEF